MSFDLLATVVQITQSMHSSLGPIINILTGLGVSISVLFLIIGGFNYITSSGNPQRLYRAKRIILNSLIGLVVVLSAMVISNLLITSFGQVGSNQANNQLPLISTITPKNPPDGIINLIIKAISGVFANIIQTISTPFLNALIYFTSGTTLGINNKPVYELWLTSVGIADGLLVLILILIGFRIMSFSIFGFREISIGQILPQVGLIFVLLNSSIYVIDLVIQISNIMIKVIANTNAVSSFWKILELVINQSNGYSLAALLIMLIFLILSAILLIYYIFRIVIIYLGMILAPLVLLCLLIPGLKDIALQAMKRYFSTIFVLFIHVVIIELASSLLIGIIAANKGLPDPLMSLVLGLATIISLIKTPGALANISQLSSTSRFAKKSSEIIVGGVSRTLGLVGRGVGVFIPQRSKVPHYTPSYNRINQNMADLGGGS